jgi:2'-5' RNA ligase
MSDFFNIALLPADENLAYTCTYLAQTNFKEQSAEYLLGDDAYPHITICQFRAEQDQANQIWSSIENMQTESILLKFGHIYILPCSGIHAGKTWVGLTVIKAVKLVQLQKSIYETLSKLGVESATKATNYSPHLTWARCEGDKPITITLMPPKELWQKQYAFNLTIGLSDINGAYQKRLFHRGYKSQTVDQI